MYKSEYSETTGSLVMSQEFLVSVHTESKYPPRNDNTRPKGRAQQNTNLKAYGKLHVYYTISPPPLDVSPTSSKRAAPPSNKQM